MSLDAARAVADAVLYEGYLLYPYRSTSEKNSIRWQFGVLGPQEAASGGLGEESGMAIECLLRPREDARLAVALRFLQLQSRMVEKASADGLTPVPELRCGETTWLTWDEAVEHEVELGWRPLADLTDVELPVAVAGGDEIQELYDERGVLAGRVVRRRWPLTATVRLATEFDGQLVRLHAEVENTAPEVASKQEATSRSFLGAHLLLAAQLADFVSVIDPPADAREAAARCSQRRCWPVLAGTPGDTDVVLGSPIILYDYPEVAPESAGALFDSTEIDEILTLRVMTLTDEEKAAARATDAHAAAIIDRCEQMSPEQMQRLHGILRDPHAGPSALVAGDDGPAFEPPTFDTSGKPWWDPAVDDAVNPAGDSVLIEGVHVRAGSLVRVHPRRRADAQDLFFADQVARVASVLFDVDGNTHVAVVLVDDPAAELHDWYGRYLHFAPDELEPLAVPANPNHREESRS